MNLYGGFQFITSYLKYYAEKPDLTLSPLPRYELLKPNCYQQMALQFSRGCPFDCEFCDIIVMYGKKVRTKTTCQIITELDAIRATGFSGDVFFVDDNFSGNKRAVKTLLPEIAAWRRQTRAPIEFYTQASLNIADDPALVELMTQAGFTKAFIGIETASKEALRASGKMQNLKGDMIERIHSLLERGIDVAGGFILGFDKESHDIFSRMIDFVKQAEIPYLCL